MRKDDYDAMWYVIQVMTGSEESIVLQCRRRIGETDSAGSPLRKCFIPYTKRKRRYQGEWHMEQKVLFPGYVFLVSDAPETLFLKLKCVQGMTKLLGCGQEIVPLYQEEEEFLQKLGGEKQVVEYSIGIMENDQILVTSGPLQGMEGCIKRIDRHKRMAWLEIEMMGRLVEAKVGLEIVEKR